MRRISLMLATASVLAMVACKKGQKPMPGRYAYCHLYVRSDDSIVFSTREMGDTARLPLKDPKSAEADPTMTLLNNAILKMRVGDSTNIVQKTDTMKVKPPQFANAKEVKYSIKLLDVRTQAQYQADSDRQKSAMEAKQKAITDVLEVMKRDSMLIKNRLKAVADSTKNLAKALTANQLNSQIKTTPSGLKYIILKEGKGKAVKKGDVAIMHYYGVLTNGNRFDDSYSRGQFFPLQVGVGQVIPGWDEGLQLLNEGTIALLIVPAKLGYGEMARPGLPANSDLIFYLEVMKRFDYM